MVLDENPDTMQLISKMLLYAVHASGGRLGVDRTKLDEFVKQDAIVSLGYLEDNENVLILEVKLPDDESV